MGDNAEHSLLSASAAPRWTRCYGSVALESTVPNTGSSYAAEGTAAHALAAWLLGGSPKELAEYAVSRPYSAACLASDWIGETITADGQDFVVDHEFASAVQEYVDYCRSLGGIGMAETKVNYANWLGVADDLAWGTSDWITVHDDPVIIAIDEDGYLCPHDMIGARIGRLIMHAVDLKFGKGVAVSPRHNEQAMLYGGGSLNEIEMILEAQDTDIICLVIHQPRIGEGEPQEWYLTVGELKHWLRGEAATAAAHAVKIHDDVVAHLAVGGTVEEAIALVPLSELTPGDKQCRFCNAKSICPALTQMVASTVANKFVDLSEPEGGTIAKTMSAGADAKAYTPVELAEKLRWAPLIESWLKDIRAAGEAALIADPEAVPGWKLVRGKMGARAWGDAEGALKRLVRYLGTAKAVKPREPISPTSAEKLVKDKQLTAKQWAELQKLITQAEGGVSMAPASDPRPALDMRPAPFTNLAEDADDLSYGADLV